MDKLLLGIDVGTTATKAALFSADGTLVAVDQADYLVQHVRPGWVEQDPEDWWQALCTAVRKALAKVPDGALRIGALAVSAQAPTLLALDADGRPVRPALIWMDRRAEAETHTLVERFGAQSIFQITGNRADAFYVAPKLLWFKTHEPELLAKTRRFVQINGYINFRLTGQYTLDEVHAALLGLRHYKHAEWNTSLCDGCGVSPDQFPPIFPGYHIQGEVTRVAAEATGLRIGTPVMVGTVDGAAAAVEAGAFEPGAAAEMTGTSTVLLMPSDGRLTESAFIAMPHALPGLHLLLGAMVSSGASLRWFRDQFGALELEQASRTGADPFDVLTEHAAEVQPGSAGLLFLPYMLGERSPLWHTNARGVFFGLSLATPRAALTRSILEGVAFALRHNVDVARQAGVTFSEIRSVGGGTRSPLWNQIKADVLGLPVALPRTSVGAPFGDAVLAGMGLGLYPAVRQALRDMIHIDRIFEPNAATHALYDDLYPVFRSIYDHLHDDFDNLAAVVGRQSS